MNSILLFGAIILAFPCVVMAGKFFGKYGLIAWVAIATVLANIMVTKQVDMLGMSVTLGNVFFSSTFLATDILSERCGLKVAKRAVQIGLLSALIFIVATQYSLLFQPNIYDTVNDSMKTLFAISARTTTVSVIMFYLSNLADVYVYDWLKKKLPKAVWVRNNVATILCNGTENFLFITMAFYGIYTLKECVMIGLTTTVVEVIIAICDTPFVYWGIRAYRER